MVLVEEGPWETSEVENRLRQLQERLYGYVDIAVDGHLANLYPDSKGKRITIRLNCYDTPEESVKEFFERFANHVKQWDEVQREIKRLGFVNSLEFEYSRGTLGNEG
jgi:hypothetical protein